MAVKMATSANTQRNPADSPRNPPIIGPVRRRLRHIIKRGREMFIPSAGPRYGATEKTANATPSSFGSKISEIVPVKRSARSPKEECSHIPPALVNGEEPKLPLKKRRMITVQMFWEPMRPALKAVKAK
jgi:hypothetical protein